MARVLRLLAALALAATPTLAVEYHVATTGSDTTGTGTAGNPFRTPAGCISAMSASGGDDCTVHTGTYTGTCNTSGSRFSIPLWDFSNKNGTAGNLAIIRAAAGETVTLCQGTGTTCWDQAQCPAIGVLGNSGTTEYQVYQGFRIRGYLRIGGSGHSGIVRNIRVTENNITGGGGCDGNFQMLRIDTTTNVTADHNWLHDTVATGSGSNPNCCTSSGAGCETCCTNGHWSAIKIFGGTDTIMEYNTIEDLDPSPQSGSKFFIDDKDCSVRPILRYNEFKDGGMRYDTQVGNCHGENPGGFSMYGNTVDAADGAAYIQPETAGSSANMGVWHIFNNTFGRFAFWPAGGSSKAPSTMMVRNNLWYNQSTNPGNYAASIPSAWFASRASWDWNYNRYRTVASNLFQGAGTSYTTPSAWGTALTCSGCEANSSTGNPPCAVVGGGNWHLVGGDPCETAGGAVAAYSIAAGGQIGAYGVTSCVGWLCGAAAQTCGNNSIEGTEVCDGTQVPSTCATQGFQGGTLACNGTCTGYDTSGCFNASSKRSTINIKGGVTIK